MACEVDEAPACRDGWHVAPGHGFAARDWSPGLLAEPDLDVAWLADATGGDTLLDGEVPRQGSPIVGHEQGHACFAKRRDHCFAFRGAGGHRFFHVRRFARGGATDRDLGMRRRRRGHVHGVDLRVGDERVGVVVPAGHAMSQGIVTGQGCGPSHDGHEGGPVGLLEGGATFFLGDIAAAHDAPTHDALHESVIANLPCAVNRSCSVSPGRSSVVARVAGERWVCCCDAAWLYGRSRRVRASGSRGADGTN